MNKQELYKGCDYFKCGYLNCRILVVGHQKVANGEAERKLYQENPIKYLDDPNHLRDNIELMESLTNGEWKEWPKNEEDRNPTRTYLQFARMLSGNHSLTLGSSDSDKIWKSIAFCNFLQVPNFRRQIMGEEERRIYDYSKEIFEEYLYDAKPDHIIVWGVHAYNCVKSISSDTIDERHCLIKLNTGDVVQVIRINHPCIVSDGYEKAHQRLKQFLNG